MYTVDVATSFPSQELAEWVIAETVNRNEAVVLEWFDGGVVGDTEVFEATFVDKKS